MSDTTVFYVTHYKWMDNLIGHHILHSVCGGKFNVFRHLKMHKSLETQMTFTLFSPYLSSITWRLCTKKPQMQLRHEEHQQS